MRVVRIRGRDCLFHRAPGGHTNVQTRDCHVVLNDRALLQAQTLGQGSFDPVHIFFRLIRVVQQLPSPNTSLLPEINL